MMLARTTRGKRQALGMSLDSVPVHGASCVVRSSGSCAEAIAFAVVCVAAAGCHRSQSASFNAAAPARTVLRDPSNAFWQTRAPDRFFVRFETTKGAFVVGAVRAWAPRGVDRFYQLVRSGYFDDSRFSRVRAGYIVQFGIAGDPAIAQRWRDQRIGDDSVRHTNARGTCAFAMTGPDTRTTQIYINLRDNPQLDAQGFAPIGSVVRGMDVVDRLNSEYGETAGGGMRGGKQGPVFEGGNDYLDRNYPRLDHLIRATIVRAP